MTTLWTRSNQTVELNDGFRDTKIGDPLTSSHSPRLRDLSDEQIQAFIDGLVEGITYYLAQNSPDKFGVLIAGYFKSIQNYGKEQGYRLANRDHEIRREHPDAIPGDVFFNLTAPTESDNTPTLAEWYDTPPTSCIVIVRQPEQVRTNEVAVVNAHGDTLGTAQLKRNYTPNAEGQRIPVNFTGSNGIFYHGMLIGQPEGRVYMQACFGQAYTVKGRNLWLSVDRPSTA